MPRYLQIARVFWNVNIGNVYRLFNFVNVWAWVYNICIYAACTSSYCSKSVLNDTQQYKLAISLCL